MPNRGYPDEKRRSRSRSTSRRYRHRDSRSRSRSGSIEERRRRRNSPRSRHNDSRNRQYSRRYRDDSRSYSRSRSRSHSSDRTDRHTSRRKEHYSSSKSRHEDYHTKASTSRHLSGADDMNSIENLPLPKQRQTVDSIGSYYNLDGDEPIDKARIHREMEEKLRQALAKEGKVYPPPKPEASHPVFANDGSFLEIFKKMQEAQQNSGMPSSAAAAGAGLAHATLATTTAASTSTAAAYIAATSTGKSAPPPPLVGRRRGGKILKTGLVAKPKVQSDAGDDPKDFWALYLAEVNKYKNNACESESGNRPLVK